MVLESDGLSHLKAREIDILLFLWSTFEHVHLQPRGTSESIQGQKFSWSLIYDLMS